MGENIIVTGNNTTAADPDDDEKQMLCQNLNITKSVGFLNQKICDEWKKSCCEKHESFLADYVLKSILEELNQPGQRTPTRLLDLSMAVKRLAIIFREEEIHYNLELAILMKNYISRYIRDPIPIVCHMVLDALDNFMQSNLNLVQSDGSDGENILESLCQMFFERLTKFTIRALILFMKHTRCDLIDEDTWRRLYAKIGNTEVTTAITDLIVFHGIKLANENKGLGQHFDEMRRCLLEGTIEQRRAIQTKLLPKMFKSVELRNVFNNESMTLLNVHDDFYSAADPIRAIEVVLSMTKFFIFNPTSTALSWHDCVDIQLLAEAIVVDDVEVRMLAWHLICQNPRLTRPFSFDELLLARLFITSNMTEQNPGIRQKIVAEFKILMQRMRESYKLLKKKTTPENRDLFFELATSELFPAKTKEIAPDDECNTIILSNQKEFLQFIHDFIFESIGEEANFNRKLLALFLIEMMHESEASYKNGAADLMYKELEMQSWLNQECYDRLRAVMNDDFEINQGIAEKLLSKLRFKDVKRPHYDKIPLDFKNNYYKSRCFWKDVFAGGDQHLQAAMKNIQFLIQKEIESIEKDKEEYLGGYIPLTNLIVYVNGFFESGIYSQIENIEPWQKYIPQTLIPLCLTVGKLVSPVVHSQAPEGFYPIDKSEEDVDGEKGKERSKKAQQLLVNCWRTHKEISVVFKNFLQFAFEKSPSHSLSKTGMKLIPTSLLQNLKDYLWTQLTECRQIGAFESAAITFQIICSILWKLEDVKKDDDDLPHDYSAVDSPTAILDKLISSLEGTTDDRINNLCETRRSAGLPPLIVAILITEPKQRNHSAFTKTLERMFAINSQDPGMIIHTINCLVAIFESSELSEIVKQFLTPAFLLCFREPPDSNEEANISFTDHWPIRNTISRLFNAVIRRMFGTPNKSQRSLFISPRCTKASNDVFIQLPTLYKIMKELFQSYAKETSPNPRNEFHMYPLLTMLTHITPSNTADYPLSIFHPYLLKIFLQSRCQKIRELSAVALITTTQEHEFVAICQWLCEKLETIKKSNNAIDGCFLLLNLCLERHCGDIPETIIGACQQLFQGLFDVIDIGSSLADIPFYYLLTSAKYLASDENLQKLADAGIEMIQASGKFENEKCLSFTGFAELLVFHQDLWKERKEKCSLKLRLECYNLATELDVEFLDQLYKDFGEVKSDEEISMVLKPLTLNHDYLDEEIFPVIEKLLSTHSPTSEIYFDLMDCFTYLRAEKKLSKKETAKIKAFFEEASTSYEENIRLKAMKIWITTATTHRTSKFYDEFMSMSLIGLQDCSSEIRTEVAKVMNEWLLSTELSLNPTILWSFAATNNPKLIQQLFNGKFEKTKETFQPTALNPFAEKTVLPEMEILSELLIVIERYKAHHREDNISRRSL